MIGLPIHAIAPLLAQSSGHESVPLVEDALRRASEHASPGLVVAPAGLAHVEHEDEALEQAELLRNAARRTGVALLFGIDVGPPQPGSGRLYACLGGSPVAWPSVGQRAFPADASRRLLRFGDKRVLPLFAAEALDPAAPRRLAQLGVVDAIVVLSHGGATARWAPALARLERIAPILVAAHRGGAGRAYASPALGVAWMGLSVPKEVLARAA